MGGISEGLFIPYGGAGIVDFFGEWEGADKVVPEGTMTVVEEVYLTPLREPTERLEKLLKDDRGDKLKGWGEHAKEGGLREVEMMKERVGRCKEVGVGK